MRIVHSGGWLRKAIRLGAAVFVVVMFSLTITPSSYAVTITFEQLPDGTPIQNYGCGEITFDSFRPWGVLFTPADGAELYIGSTEPLCLSPWHDLRRCDPWTGTLNITFVEPGTDVSTVVDRMRLAVLTQTGPLSNNRVNTYNAQGELLDTWAMTPGYCGEPPHYFDFYDFSALGQIARVECILVNAAIDDVIVESAATPVEGATWGHIKSFYRDATR